MPFIETYPVYVDVGDHFRLPRDSGSTTAHRRNCSEAHALSLSQCCRSGRGGQITNCDTGRVKVSLEYRRRSCDRDDGFAGLR